MVGQAQPMNNHEKLVVGFITAVAVICWALILGGRAGTLLPLDRGSISSLPRTRASGGDCVFPTCHDYNHTYLCNGTIMYNCTTV